MQIHALKVTKWKKKCYMGSGWSLPLDHSWRNKTKAFDGTKENHSASTLLSGNDIIQVYQQFERLVLLCVP